MVKHKRIPNAIIQNKKHLNIYIYRILKYVKHNNY